MSICQKSFSISFMNCLVRKETSRDDLKKNHVKLICSLKKKTCKFDSLSNSRTTIGICSTINCNTRISKSYATKKQFYYLSSCIKSNKFQTSSSLKKV